MERADIESAAKYKMWEGFLWQSGNYMRTLRTFVFSQGKRYQDLIPNPEFVLPNRTHETGGFEGWAYAAATRGKDFLLAYWEKGCPTGQLRGVLSHANYEAKWFDPRKGEWLGDGVVFTSNMNGVVRMPKKPTDDDWGMQILLKNVVPLGDGPAPPAQ